MVQAYPPLVKTLRSPCSIETVAQVDCTQRRRARRKEVEYARAFSVCLASREPFHQIPPPDLLDPALPQIRPERGAQVLRSAAQEEVPVEGGMPRVDEPLGVPFVPLREEGVLVVLARPVGDRRVEELDEREVHPAALE